jgi:hypothetical protein
VIVPIYDDFPLPQRLVIVQTLRKIADELEKPGVWRMHGGIDVSGFGPASPEGRGYNIKADLRWRRVDDGAPKAIAQPPAAKLAIEHNKAPKRWPWRK